MFGVASCISLLGLVYYYFYARDLSSERRRILARRSELSTAIADDYTRLRTTLEAWTVAAARAPFPGDHVDPDARLPAWRERPSVYLRMRLAEATGASEVHNAAKLASLDGLSSCLLRLLGQTKGSGPWAYGEVVARAEMLGSEFISEVRETKNDLLLRNLKKRLDDYQQTEYPEARDAVRLVEIAVIALDEDPEVIPQHSAAYGADATIAQRISPVMHPLRLYVRRLSDGRELLRIRSIPEVNVVQVQGDATAAAAALEIRRSQILGCSMANEALALAGLDVSPDFFAPRSPLPVAKPSASANPAPSISVSATPSAVEAHPAVAR
ncbi:MAG: hypothetical protein NVS3B20_03470 [Polyangiales bacterium]